MGTKGTWRRPAAISDAEVEVNWDRAFRPELRHAPLAASSRRPNPTREGVADVYRTDIAGPEVAEPTEKR